MEDQISTTSDNVSLLSQLREVIEKPYGWAILAVLLYSTFGAFWVVERCRQKQRETKEFYNCGQTVWGLLYAVSLSVVFAWIAWAYLDPKSTMWTLVVVFLPIFHLMTTDIQPKFISKALTSSISFGVGGIITCGFLISSILCLARAPGKEYEFLSAVCFGMAAWFSCSLGSIAGWAAHAEYGEFADEKRRILSVIQLYFMGGFAFLLTSALHDGK